MLGYKRLSTYEVEAIQWFLTEFQATNSQWWLSLRVEPKQFILSSAPDSKGSERGMGVFRRFDSAIIETCPRTSNITQMFRDYIQKIQSYRETFLECAYTYHLEDLRDWQSSRLGDEPVMPSDEMLRQIHEPLDRKLWTRNDIRRIGKMIKTLEKILPYRDMWWSIGSCHVSRDASIGFMKTEKKTDHQSQWDYDNHNETGSVTESLFQVTDQFIRHMCR